MQAQVWYLLLLAFAVSNGQGIPSVPGADAYATPKPHHWANIQWLTTESPVVDEDESIAKPRLYELTNDMNLVCFRAILDAQIFFSYNAKKADNTLTVKRQLLRLPEKPVVSGDCYPTAAEFKLTWEGGFELFFRFEIQGSEWSATEVEFLVDTEYLGDAIQSGIVLANNHNGTEYFTSPLSRSFKCDYYVDVPMELASDKVVNAVSLRILNMQVQAFGVPQSHFSEPTYCTPTFVQQVQSNMVPVIVASVLAAVIVLIVIVYFIYKNRASKYEVISGHRIYEHIKETSSTAFGHVKNASNQAVDRVKDASNQAVDRVKSASNQAVERVRSAYTSYSSRGEHTDATMSEQTTYTSLEEDLNMDDDEVPIMDQVDESNQPEIEEQTEEKVETLVNVTDE